MDEEDFNELILPYLVIKKRGPKCQIGYHKLFNYILKVLYTGMQFQSYLSRKTLKPGNVIFTILMFIQSHPLIFTLSVWILKTLHCKVHESIT